MVKLLFVLKIALVLGVTLGMLRQDRSSNSFSLGAMVVLAILMTIPQLSQLDEVSADDKEGAQGWESTPKSRAMFGRIGKSVRKIGRGAKDDTRPRDHLTQRFSDAIRVHTGNEYGDIAVNQLTGQSGLSVAAGTYSGDKTAGQIVKLGQMGISGVGMVNTGRQMVDGVEDIATHPSAGNIGRTIWNNSPTGRLTNMVSGWF